MYQCYNYYFLHTQKADNSGPVSQSTVHGTCSSAQSFTTALPAAQLYPVHPSWQPESPETRSPVTAPLVQPDTGARAAGEGLPWSLQIFEGAPPGQQQVGEGPTKHSVLQEPASVAAGSQSHQVSVCKVIVQASIKLIAVRY